MSRHGFDVDVVVIGGGPAGAGTAYRLASAGASVVLVEKQRLPRGKVCGGCVHRRGAALLARWGLAERVLVGTHATRLVGGELVAGGRELRWGSGGWGRGHGFGVERGAFDGALVEAAADAGAAIRDGVSAKVEQVADDAEGRWAVRLRSARGGMREQSAEQTLRPRWVVAADGLGGSSLAGLNKTHGFGIERAAGSYVGGGARVDGITWARSVRTTADTLGEGRVRMYVGPGGYVGAVRAAGVALGADAATSRDVELASALDPAFVKQHGGAGPASAAILAAATRTEPETWEAIAQAPGWRMTPALTSRRQRVAAPGLLVVGDAAGYVEPFTGEGITWALEAARDAAALLHPALREQQSASATAAAWSRRYSRVHRFGRRWCRTSAALLRHPNAVGRLTALAAMIQHPAHGHQPPIGPPTLGPTPEPAR